MKYRKGFVSNSSSSSYIVAINEHSEPCPCCGRRDVGFLDLIEKSEFSNDDNKVYATGYDDIIKEVNDGYGYEERDFTKEEIKQEMKKYADMRWRLAYIAISYHDDVIKDTMENMIKAGTLKKIFSFGD